MKNNTQKPKSETEQPNPTPKEAVAESEANTGCAEASCEQETECECEEQEKLQTELAAKQKQCEELAAQFTRLRADFDNYKRRTRTELEEIRGRAAENLITRLLPVLDNLDRALGAAKSTTDASSIAAGLDLVRRGLMEQLTAEGLEEVPGVGSTFDPYMHEAVDRTGDNASHVVAEYQKGYKLVGRVLRAAMVKVGPAPAADTDGQ